jgi:hypothetical protein
MREGVEPQREHVMAHLRACPECQDIYRENEGIAYCLTCLPPVDPPQSLVPKILDHIKATVKIVAPDSVATVISPIGRLYVAFRHSGITAVALDRGVDSARRSPHVRLDRGEARAADRRTRRRSRDGAQSGAAALPVPPRRRREWVAAPLRLRHRRQSAHLGARRL